MNDELPAHSAPPREPPAQPSRSAQVIAMPTDGGVDIPPMFDRRKAKATAWAQEPTFVDLVTGGAHG